MGSMSTTKERQSADLQAERQDTETTADEQQVPSTSHATQQKPALTLLPIRHTKVNGVLCMTTHLQVAFKSAGDDCLVHVTARAPS